MSFAAYATEYSIPQLTANQLDIVGKVITALSPIGDNKSCFSQCCLSVTHHPICSNVIQNNGETSG